jgi:hypothetical protein
MDRFYVYLFLREDGTPYYVGKGTGGRQFRRRRQGLPQLPTDCARNIRILDGMNEADAFAWETLLIARWGCKHNGTGILRNGNAGGKGGSSPSEETRKKLSATQRARYSNPAERAKQSATWSPAARARISEAQKTRYNDPEVRAEHGKKMKARYSDPELRARQSAITRAQLSTPEARAERSERLKKRFSTPEARASQSKKARAGGAIRASKSAAELGISLDAYMGMSRSQRGWALKKARETPEERIASQANKAAGARAGGATKAAAGAAELGISLDAYMAMPRSSRAHARRRKRVQTAE